MDAEVYFNNEEGFLEVFSLIKFIGPGIKNAFSLPTVHFLKSISEFRGFLIFGLKPYTPPMLGKPGRVGNLTKSINY